MQRARVPRQIGTSFSCPKVALNSNENLLKRTKIERNRNIRSFNIKVNNLGVCPWGRIREKGVGSNKKKGERWSIVRENYRGEVWGGVWWKTAGKGERTWKGPGGGMAMPDRKRATVMSRLRKHETVIRISNSWHTPLGKRPEALRPLRNVCES